MLRTLAEAFDDNEAPSAAVGIDGAEVALVVLVPSADVMPEQMPSSTAAGNLSLKKLTNRETADYYKAFVCGQILVTLREAFAVAPALASARVVVLRDDGRNVYGNRSVSCLAAVNVARETLIGVQWEEAGAVEILNAVARELLVEQKGRSEDMAPLDLTSEPDIAAVIQAVDIEELAADEIKPPKNMTRTYAGPLASVNNDIVQVADEVELVDTDTAAAVELIKSVARHLPAGVSIGRVNKVDENAFYADEGDARTVWGIAGINRKKGAMRVSKIDDSILETTVWCNGREQSRSRRDTLSAYQ